MTSVIDGKLIAQKTLDQIKKQIDKIKYYNQKIPTLSVVLVGNNPASLVYVENKKRACISVGMKSIEILLPEDTTTTLLQNTIIKLNTNADVDGILVQLPLPKHIDSKIIIDTISPKKDVDGFHKYNIGALALNSPTICPCTPHGIITLLDSINFNYPGKSAVVIGSSNIVGRPMMLELLNRGCTVTVCNSKTANITSFTKNADLVIVAIGKPKFLNKQHISSNTIIIDVGINRLPNGKICGDVDFEDMIDIVKYITPVPGGVGPMTIATLISNTLICYNHNQNKEKIIQYE